FYFFFQAEDGIRDFHVTGVQTCALPILTGNDARPLFERAFLEYLRGLEFSCDVDAIPEGTPVFAYEPLVRIVGPIVQCQILETRSEERRVGKEGRCRSARCHGD